MLRRALDDFEILKDETAHFLANSICASENTFASSVDSDVQRTGSPEIVIGRASPPTVVVSEVPPEASGCA